MYCLIVFFLETFAEEAQKKTKLWTCSPNNADRKKKFKVSVCNKHHEQQYKDFKVQNYKKQNNSNNNNIINGLVSKKLTYLASINCKFYWKLRFLSFLFHSRSQCYSITLSSHWNAQNSRRATHCCRSDDAISQLHSHIQLQRSPPRPLFVCLLVQLCHAVTDGNWR